MAPSDDEVQANGQPSASTSHQRSVNKHRATIALGVLACLGVLTTLLALFGDVILRAFWSWFGVAVLLVCAVAVVGLALIMRDEQRARRSGRDHRDAPDVIPDRFL